MITQRVAGALAGVQAQVAKEAVVWRTGPLVMAPLVKLSLAAAQVALITTGCATGIDSFIQSTLGVLVCSIPLPFARSCC